MLLKVSPSTITHFSSDIKRSHEISKTSQQSEKSHSFTTIRARTMKNGLGKPLS